MLCVNLFVNKRKNVIFKIQARFLHACFCVWSKKHKTQYKALSATTKMSSKFKTNLIKIQRLPVETVSEVLKQVGGTFRTFDQLSAEPTMQQEMVTETTQHAGIDYYSGIENVAIFNAVIYPPLGCHCHVELEALGSPRGCGTYVTHGSPRHHGRSRRRRPGGEDSEKQNGSSSLNRRPPKRPPREQNQKNPKVVVNKFVSQTRSLTFKNKQNCVNE